ncbi:MAG: hypothetical protein KJO04_09380 [Bacteroidia bacterium]|nr:hypothetical protein [Bacteroidia bacterium]
MSRHVYEDLLTGGHPNSLGNTLTVVEAVLNKPADLGSLFECFFSEDAVVRMRVANAMKRIARAEKQLLLPYLDRFLDEIALIDQASTRWSLAQLFLLLDADLSQAQLKRAKKILVDNLMNESDWIVLNMTMETLGKWALYDDALKTSIRGRILELKDDPRRSVSKKALKTASLLY